MQPTELPATVDLMSEHVAHCVKTEHICVCICTYKRPEMLRRLLGDLMKQATGGLFAYSVVVVDNDKLRTAEAEVASFAAKNFIPVRFFAEPEQNIPMARNRAVANAIGDYVAFIDDDEFPAEDWLLNLLKARHEYNTDGVVGPVLRHFDEKPPKWIVKGNFWQRRMFDTGYVIEGIDGRVNNALLKKELFAGQQEPFRPEFRAGEDKDFFERMIKAGHTFVWCQEAVVYEVVPPSRWKRRFILKRSLLQGAVSPLHRNFGEAKIARSLLAVPMYVVVLPLAAVMGQHRSMAVLVKLAWHVGNILSFMGVRVIKTPYVTE